ncbi:MAG: HypC/HybG/HupF family hydrogenase formation chaperone [Planctomycetes bacterium]|nr:HypC/HybG/HupF family hydrogenase formation chaperone [Planctomycetota bacterium]
MCLGIPGRIVEILPEREPDPESGEAPLEDGAAFPLRRGVVDFGGVRKEVCLSCVSDARPGDYVVVHVGFAISKIDADEAAKVFELLAAMDELGELEAPEGT